VLNQKKIIVVLPAYNAAKTLQETYKEIPFDMVDDVILVDDASKDDTVEVAKQIGIKNIITHEKNKVMAVIRKHAMTKHFSWVLILLLCSIPIINIPLS